MDSTTPCTARSRTARAAISPTRKRSPATVHCAYVDGTNPNGSMADIAGATDATGRILGLMPHPENHIFPSQYPRHHRTAKHQTPVEQSQHLGLALFAAGVRHARRI